MLATPKIAENSSSVIDFIKFKRPDRFEHLHSRLVQIFNEEIFSEDSIFVKVKKNSITKMALFLSNHLKRPAAIGIAGETASGKSTVAIDMIEIINAFADRNSLENTITRINTDDYYYDRSKEVQAAGSFAAFAKNYDFDTPQAIELSLMKKHINLLLNNQEVYLPKYDMSGSTKRFDNHILAKPSKLIISEGLFTLTEPLNEVFDFKIFIDVSRKVQAKRFYNRAMERDLGNSADQILKNAINKALIHIRPAAFSADLIISGEADRQKYRNFVIKILRLVEEVYSSEAS